MYWVGQKFFLMEKLKQTFGQSIYAVNPYMQFYNGYYNPSFYS